MQKMLSAKESAQLDILVSALNDNYMKHFTGPIAELEQERTIARGKKDKAAEAIIQEKLDLLRAIENSIRRFTAYVAKVKQNGPSEASEDDFHKILRRYQWMQTSLIAADYTQSIFSEYTKKNSFKYFVGLNPTGFNSLLSFNKDMNNTFERMVQTLNLKKTIANMPIQLSNYLPIPIIVNPDDPKISTSEKSNSATYALSKKYIMPNIKMRDNEDFIGFSIIPCDEVGSEHELRTRMQDGFKVLGYKCRDALAGTTFNATVIHQGIVQTANIGDSRAFVVEISANDDITVISLSNEHNMKNADELRRVKDLLNEPTAPFFGINNDKIEPVVSIGKSDIAASVMSAKPALSVTRGFGDYCHQGIISSAPEFTTYKIKPGIKSYLVQSSDGMILTLDEITSILKSNPQLLTEPKLLAEKLVHESTKEKSMHDDCSVAVTNLSLIDPRQATLVTIADGHCHSSPQLSVLQESQKPVQYMGSSGLYMATYATINFAAYMQYAQIGSAITPVPSEAIHIPSVSEFREKYEPKPRSPYPPS